MQVLLGSNRQYPASPSLWAFSISPPFPVLPSLCFFFFLSRYKMSPLRLVGAWRRSHGGLNREGSRGCSCPGGQRQDMQAAGRQALSPSRSLRRQGPSAFANPHPPSRTLGSCRNRNSPIFESLVAPPRVSWDASHLKARSSTVNTFGSSFVLKTFPLQLLTSHQLITLPA